ncbi:MAG: SCP2 sterol-binding domain-containing protein [Candidatus Promineifilaceae bacterium]
MALAFPSDEWIKAAMAEVNASQAYQAAAKNWEGDITFVVTAVPDERRKAHLYMDLWHGSCREAFEVESGAARPSEFRITAPLPIWRKVLERQLDPIRAIVSQQLKLQGNKMKILKAPKAAVELVNCCAALDTAWPAV